MKTFGKISIIAAMSLLLIGCGGGSGGGSGGGTNIDYSDLNLSDLEIVINSNKSWSFINENYVVKSTDDNVTNGNFGAPEYSIIAVEVKKYIAPNFEDENVSTNIYTKDLILDFGEGPDPYGYLNRGKVLSTVEWDYTTVDSDSHLKFHGLKGVMAFPVQPDSENNPNFFTSDLLYADADNPQNDYNITRDTKIHDNGTLFIFNKTTQKSEIIVDAVEKFAGKIGYNIAYANQAELDNGNYLWYKDLKLDNNGISQGQELRIHKYNADGNATVITENVFNLSVFTYEYFNVVSTENYDVDLSRGTINNPEYVISRNYTHIGNIGDGEYYNGTSPMYEQITCNTSMDGYATTDINDNITYCVEDRNYDGEIDIAKKYTWYDKWRVDTITTQETEDTIVKQKFLYNDFGKVSRIIAYVNDVYQSHLKFKYQRQVNHTTPN